MNELDTDAIVIGGGVSGLATAWWLAQAGRRVEVWEADVRAGGRIATDEANGFRTERAATLLAGAPDLEHVIRACGLEEDLLARDPRAPRYLGRGGRLVAVPMRLGAFARSPLWSARGKLRLLAEPFVPRGGVPGETVSGFVTRRLGREVLDRALEPFVAGPLASDPERAEARAVLPRLTALEDRYGSLALGVLAGRLRRGSRACAIPAFRLRGGSERLVRALAGAAGVVLRTACPARALEPLGRGGWRVSSEALSRRARHVVLATPAPAAARLLEGIDAELVLTLRAIEHAPVTVVHLGYRRADVGHPLDGTGVLFPREECLAPTGCAWSAIDGDERAPPGHVLLDAYLGGARAPAAARASDERAVSTCLAALAPRLALRGEPVHVRVDRHPDGLPLYHGPHSARMRTLEMRLAGHPGLHLAGSYRGGVSVRDRIASARAVARAIEGALARAGRAARRAGAVTPPARPLAAPGR